jgi:hypothetical protein
MSLNNEYRDLHLKPISTQDYKKQVLDSFFHKYIYPKLGTKILSLQVF